MGTRAFVARSGWRETPITLHQWVQASAEHPDLVLQPGPAGTVQTALLRGSRRRRLSWHDGYIAAHHTNAALAAVVFELASRLDAQVYNAQRQPYAGLADWLRRHPSQGGEAGIGGRTARPSGPPRDRGARGGPPPGAGATAWSVWLPFVLAFGLIALWNTF